MRFQDFYFSREERFSTGFDHETGKYYLSFPCTNQMVDYEEYYEIPEDMAKKPQEHLPALRACLEQARERKLDQFLIYDPSLKRGVPI